MPNEIVPNEIIEKKIYLIRNRKVMLDRDLANLYGLETRLLKRAVRRNLKRFPDDFMFTLSNEETELLVSQIGIPSRSYFGGANPFAFTEYGILMLSSVLNSDKAIEINIQIMRIFAKLREIMSTHKDLAAKLAYLEQKVGKHTGKIQEIFVAIHKLMKTHEKPIRKVGFIKD